MRPLLQDLRYAVRMFRKWPAFTALAVATLALGIGANVAIFSVVEAVLIRGLPYPQADRLVTVWETEPGLRHGAPITGPDWFDWQSQNTAFEQMAAGTEAGATLSGGTEPRRIEGFEVSTNVFSLLGVQPAIGRGFRAGEDRQGRDHVVVLSYGLWQQAFAGSHGTVGSHATLDGESYEVIGIMPQGFQFPAIWGERSEFWVPLGFYRYPYRRSRGSHWLWVLGRLKAGVDLEQAQANMATIASRLAAQYPETNRNVAVKVVGLHDYLVGDTRPVLAVLLCAVGFILALACANVAHMMLAHASERVRETAVRLALGAGRGRLLTQFLVEAMLLAFVAAAAGLAIAEGITGSIFSAAQGYLPAGTHIRFDAGVFCFALLGAVAAGMIFGFAPAWSASKTDLNTVLKQASGNVARRSRFRKALVVIETASALLLLVGAGLAIRSLVNLLNVQPGFDARNVLTVRISLPDKGYNTAEQVSVFYQRALEKVRALRGVQSAGATSELPLEGSNNGYVWIEGRPKPIGFEGPLVESKIVSEDYFRSLGIPLVEGSVFTGRDGSSTRKIVVINSAMARHFWPGENPIGKRFSWDEDRPEWFEVVGVVGDVKVFSLTRDVIPEIYMPLGQWAARSDMNLVVRTAAEPLASAHAVERVIHQLDSNVPVYSISSMEGLLAEEHGPWRFNALLLTAFALIALVLACVGIYAITSHAITLRTHELGIRFALGAGRREVFGLILGDTLAMTMAGLVIGILLALAVGRLLSTLLFRVPPRDPITLLLVAMIVVMASLMAALVPARRAAKVDLMVALRYE